VLMTQPNKLNQIAVLRVGGGDVPGHKVKKEIRGLENCGDAGRVASGFCERIETRDWRLENYLRRLHKINLCNLRNLWID
jgi:hypothetical protein